MKIDKEHIAELIAKWIHKELSESEEQELQKWLESPYNKLQFNKIVDSESIDADIELREYFQSGQNWKKLNNRLNEKESKTNWLAYAAAIFIPIGVAALLFFTNGDGSEKNMNALADSFTPNEKHVVLSTSKGVKHQINSRDTLLTTNEGQIQIASNVISYQKEIKKQNYKPEYHTIHIPKGQNYTLNLSDGTQVWLNAQTTFRYPVKFAGNTREVQLVNGEAYFDVTSNKQKPFIVNFYDSNVKVLGTRFNVKSYKEDEEEEITLEEGSVIVESYANTIRLIPNQQLSLNKISNKFDLRNVDAGIYGAWRKGVLKYRDEPLSKIMNDLQRHYEFKVFYQSHSIQNKKFSISINPKKSIHEILKFLQSTGNVEFQAKGNVITILNK
jgi:ferric-dicitrate binding protein FerR (iron transport regulator)